MGALANEVRERIANAIADKNEKLEEEEMKQKLAGQTIDVTFAGEPCCSRRPPSAHCCH
nr:hypothetical protein [Bacillus subtilis]